MNIERVLSVLKKTKSAGNEKWTACCPAHDDNTPSLSIAVKSGKVLFKCWAGCSGMEIAENLILNGCQWDDLFSEPSEHERSFFPRPDRKFTDKDWLLKTARASRASGVRLSEAEKKAEIMAYMASRRAG